MDGFNEYRFDPAQVPSPCFVIDTGLLAANLDVLDHVRNEAGCSILLALKCYAAFSTFPLIAGVLDGVCASSPHEARLGREEFGKEVHTFAAGYSREDILALCRTTDHLVFNSFSQLERFRPLVQEQTRTLGRAIQLGIRINPEHSEGAVPIYDPCSPGSRLGVRRPHFRNDCLEGVQGLHWHNLCEQDADCLQRTVAAVEAAFSDVLPGMSYVNFGGGHHITRPGYNLDLLKKVITDFRKRWNVDVYLEPGEAVAMNAGYLVSTVLDVVEADIPIAIMDASVPAHMPDVLEMPYRPNIIGSGPAGDKAFTYRIGGLSCLAGDVAGEYSFDRPLAPGSTLVFADMAIYTMVKTTTFNGVRLPSIAVYSPADDRLDIVREFGYQDFKTRLS